MGQLENYKAMKKKKQSRTGITKWGKNYYVGHNTPGLGISKNTFQIKISLEKHMN